MSDVKFRDEGTTLEIERVINAPRGAVWRCWTEPELLKQWFCPKPWRVSEADFDLRPGGRMNTTMQGPNGESHAMQGVWLEVEHGRRLTFSGDYLEGFVPAAETFMTGYVELSDVPGGATRMVWGARHRSEEVKAKHLEMGFDPGWRMASDQLAELAAEVAALPGGAQTFAAPLRTCLFLAGDIEAAVARYVELLPNSSVDQVVKPSPEGPAMVVEFTLNGAPCMALAGNPDPKPSALTSLSVLTKDQAETDRLWAALLEGGGEAGRCGWLQDRHGVHWQIVPEALPRLMSGGDAASAGRVQNALMGMSKIDIAGLEAALKGA